jgi:hypothetical protein
VKSWTVKHPLGHCDFEISGNTLPEAIEANFKAIAGRADLGNAAGYKVHDVTIEYKPGILGGQGGAELTIVHTGLPLASGKTDNNLKTKTIWIYAAPEDLPRPGKLEL